MPEALQRLADNARITVRRGGEPPREAKCVLYWMQRAQRGIDNPALDVAIALGNELGLPVVAFFSAINNFPHANWRHYHFLSQGLIDAEQDLAERNVAFIVRRPPHNALEKLVVELRAAAVVADENPMREPERWRQVLAHRIEVPYWTVDADCIVPANTFTKHFYAAHHFRPKFFVELPRFLATESPVKAQHTWNRPHDFASFHVGDNITEGWGEPFDRSVRPVDSFTGGTRAAQKLLADFVTNKLSDYNTVRNHPERDGTSRISPALHFGHIGPLTITRAIEDAVKKGNCTTEARDAYYGEVLAWRELCVNFVRFVPAYDSIECAPDWARETLKKHSRDAREHPYTLQQMERAETHDDMWNAAQKQMVDHGWMHNILRMYWGKKILEWSATPAEAFTNCVYLNDKYFLDGRDPNGYANIAWAICGVHDRPWFERPIFGTVRYMSRESTGRKFNSKLYMRNIAEGNAFGAR
ncbi:deoxyribodipyrimidine photolyase [Acidipila sp. EB88]|nr:deoxyribodipyrimidine photolyase [Acidipila sp. EB88]